ncbi:MAG: hypothetical protein ACRD21_07270, partial [Vicinamibacteria bacterium]
MSKALLKRLSLRAAAAVGLVLAGTIFTTGLPLWARLLSAAVTSAGALLILFQAVRLALVIPLRSLAETTVELRTRTGPLPKELPIQRTDEVGALAREVALLAGERNVAQLRREESEAQIAALTEAMSDAVFRVDRDSVVLAHQNPKDVPFFIGSE